MSKTSHFLGFILFLIFLTTCNNFNVENGNYSSQTRSIHIQGFDVFSIDGSIFEGDGIVKQLFYHSDYSKNPDIIEVGKIENGKLFLFLPEFPASKNWITFHSPKEPTTTFEHCCGSFTTNAVIYSDTVTVYPPDARIISGNHFRLDNGTSDQYNEWIYIQFAKLPDISEEIILSGVSQWSLFVYAEKPFTVKGTIIEKNWHIINYNDYPDYNSENIFDISSTYDVSLNQGWNIIYVNQNFTYDETLDSSFRTGNLVFTYSTDPSAVNIENMKWIVYQ